MENCEVNDSYWDWLPYEVKHMILEFTKFKCYKNPVSSYLYNDEGFHTEPESRMNISPNECCYDTFLLENGVFHGPFLRGLIAYLWGGGLSGCNYYSSGFYYKGLKHGAFRLYRGNGKLSHEYFYEYGKFKGKKFHTEQNLFTNNVGFKEEDDFDVKGLCFVTKHTNGTNKYDMDNFIKTNYVLIEIPKIELKPFHLYTSLNIKHQDRNIVK